MRVVFALIALTLAVSGCKARKHHPNPAATIEEQQELSSSVNVADPADSTQLLSGFHAVEGQSWRWTMQKFSVSLAPLPVKPCKLTLQFVLPEVVASKMLGVSITPVVGGKPLAPFKVTKTGEQTAVFDVPDEQLKSDGVIVEFQLDRAVEPSDSDSRQLGLIVSQIGFKAQ